ncbi:MAG: ATP-binding cassette domain-containing protein, partial [Solirubrobacterales bacterium]
MSAAGPLRVEAAMPLREFDLALAVAVEAGECLAVAGPSGAGKTTLLRIAAGLLRPPAGRVALGEEVWLDTSTGDELPAEQRHCGLVFQDYALFPTLSAWRNVAFGMRGPRRE